MYLRDILFEAECPVCRIETEYPNVCEDCAARLDACVRRDAAFVLTSKTCGRLEGSAALRYDECCAALLFYLKQYDVKGVFTEAARYMAYAANALPLSDGAVFVSVPRSRANVRKYGFDHAALLARECARMMPFDAKYVPLVKRRAGRDTDQKTLDREHRIDNVSDRFAVSKTALSRLDGARCAVIVDDIVTTGSSLLECASVIRAALPKLPLYALTLAKASEDPDYT